MKLTRVDAIWRFFHAGKQLAVHCFSPEFDEADKDVIRAKSFDDVASIVSTLGRQWDRGDVGNWPGLTGSGGACRPADACLPRRWDGHGHAVKSNTESLGLITLVNRVNRHGSLIPIHRIVVEARIVWVQPRPFQLFVDDSLAISICTVLQI
jgi:hypothetical protein